MAAQVNVFMRNKKKKLFKKAGMRTISIFLFFKNAIDLSLDWSIKFPPNLARKNKGGGKQG